MTRTLLDLPPEIQTGIASWVLRPKDIARLCLVSRQLYDVSMPGLYHSMYLNVDRWKKQNLERFLCRGHRGHQHVRTLDVDSDELSSEPGARKLAKDILEILPRNCLTSFRCPLETGIDNDLMILLSSTQRNLDFLSLGPLLQNALNIPEGLSPWPPKIKTVVVPWKFNVSADQEFYKHLIQRSGRTLTALTVRSETILEHDNRPIPKDIAMESISRVLAMALFNTRIDIDSAQTMLALSDLNLQNQDFVSAGSMWLRAIDFTKLRTLQLWNCSSADVLLSELMILNQTTPLKLHGLALSFEERRQAPLQGLKFVASISGLKYLNLCYCPMDPPTDIFTAGGWLLHSVLEPHKASIKDLYFGVGANNSLRKPLYVPDSDDLKLLCSTCRNIRQLAIPMPPIRFDDAFANRWQTFGAYLDSLATLPKLKTLRILTWPIIADKEYLAIERIVQKRTHRRWFYLKYLDVLATSIVRKVRYRRQDLQGEFPDTEYQGLSVLIFGSAERHDAITRADGWQDHYPIGPISYKVRRRETKFGAITIAERIDSRRMEFEEPVAYVVDEDTDQGLSLEAYTWGS